MTVASTDHQWPPDRQIADLVHAGIRVIELEGAVTFAGTPEGAIVRFVRFLRDATSRLVVVRWSPEGLFLPDEFGISHLCPPNQSAREPQALTQWRRNHRYGAFFWRQGPGFVLVKDTRPGRPVASYLIEGELDMQAFHALQTARRRSSLPMPLREPVDALIEMGLAVHHADWVTLLPTRIRLWPVPFTAI